MIPAALVTWLLLCLAAAVVCSDSKRREQAQARAMHPSNYAGMPDIRWAPFDTATVVPLLCEHCHQPVYHVATTGHDLLVVLRAEFDAFDAAVDEHRETCGRVSA